MLVTASDTALGKPNPDPYLAAAARLGVAPEECLVVEDAVAGVRPDAPPAARRSACSARCRGGRSARTSSSRTSRGVRVERDGELLRIVVDQPVAEPDRKMSRT